MWETVRLGEIANLYQPKTITKKEMSDDGKYPVYGANGIIGKYHSYNHEDSQLVIGCRGSCGEVNVTQVKSWITGNAMVIRPTGAVLKEYLRYFLLQRHVTNAVISGTAQPQITRKSLAPIELKLPPRAEQQRIVAKLDAVFAEIDKAVEATTASIEQAQIGLSNLIDDKTSNKSDWREFKVSDLGKVQTGNTPKTSEKKNYGNDIPFVKPPHFRTDGSIEIVEDGLSQTGAKLSRKAPPNSVMMVCIGATIGKVAVCHEEVCFNQQINSLSPAKDYDAELIYWQMRGNRFQKDIRERAGQATLPIISKAKWANLSIYLPSNTEAQVKIRNQLRALSDLTDKYCSMRASKIDALNDLKSAILAQELQPPQSDAA